MEEYLIHICFPVFITGLILVSATICGKKKNPPQSKPDAVKPAEPQPLWQVPSAFRRSTKRLGTKLTTPVKPLNKKVDEKVENDKPKKIFEDDILLTTPPIVASLPPPPTPLPLQQLPPPEPSAIPSPPPLIVEENDVMCVDTAPLEMRKLVDELACS